MRPGPSLPHVVLADNLEPRFEDDYRDHSRLLDILCRDILGIVISI